MNKIASLLLFCCFLQHTAKAQSINTDSLLFKGLESFKNENYTKAIAEGRLGVTLAPDYTDFYMLLGRCFLKTGKVEAAEHYFAHVIATAPQYKDAFIQSIGIANASKAYPKALRLGEQAMRQFGNDKELRLLQLKTHTLAGEEEAVISYLEELLTYYPNDPALQNTLRRERAKTSSNRIGLDHNYTIFNRDGVGPWLLSGLYYVRERKNATLIGRLNYADRQAQGQSIRYGYQVELDTYIKTGSKGTSLANLAYSDNEIFPNIRASYSYLHNFDTGWELDLGVRYIKPANRQHIYASAAGIGKYLGSSWLNLSTFLFFDQGENFVTVSGTYRYYFKTKHDFMGMVLGYGSSPDESINITPFTTQVSLDSYRAGLVFSSTIGNRLIVGAQLIGNRQEYIEGSIQNQLDIFASLQYKL